MSNRRNRRSRRGHLLTEKRDLAKEREVLSSQVNPTGRGEDPAIAALLQSEKGTHSQQLEAALAAQRVLRGKAAMLDNPEELGQEVARLRAKAAAMDEAERRWNEDREKFVNDVWDKAEKLLPTKAKKEEMQAKGAQVYQQAMQMATANRETRKLWMMDQIKNGRQEEIMATGHWVTPEGHSPILEPDVIRIEGLNPVVLTPGKHLVSWVIAERYRQTQHERAKQEAMQNSLRVGNDGTIRAQDDVQREWAGIERQYGERA